MHQITHTTNICCKYILLLICLLFTIIAQAANINITANIPNPIHQGDLLTLTATRARSECRWEYSYDETNWQSYTTNVEGTNNNTIHPNPLITTYYRATDNNGNTGTYKVMVVIKCEGQVQTHLDLTFGTLPTEQHRRSVDGVKERINELVYAFSPTGKEIHDGFYAILANPRYGGKGNRTTPYSCYDTDCLGDVDEEGTHYWYNDINDHTPDDVNGGMLMLNCQSSGEVMYEYTATNLCTNMYMTFSAWFANAATAGGVPINTRFKVLDKHGQEIVSARLDVDDISVSDGWIQGSTSFFSGDNESLTVQIINNGSSGVGNDILIDDIQFKSCVPLLSFRPLVMVECGSAATLTVETEGIDQIFDGTPYYLWQRYNYDTEEWETIAEDPDPSQTSFNGSGWGKISYVFTTESQPVNKPRFRTLVSSDPAVLRQVVQNIFPVCINYAISEVIDVDCTCIPQSLIHTSGSEQQNICLGTPIEAVTYQVSGRQTTGVKLLGYTFNNGTMIPSQLPEGIEINHNSSLKSCTITGTPTAIGTYKLMFDADSQDAAVCEVEPLILTLNVQEGPTLTVIGNSTQSNCQDEPLDEVVFTYGGTATGASLNIPMADALAKGYTFTTNTTAKTITVTGTFKETLHYTISTTGQSSACAASTLSGTFSVVAPLQAPIITDNGNAITTQTVCQASNSTYSIVPNIADSYNWVIEGGVANTDYNYTPSTNHQLEVQWNNIGNYTIKAQAIKDGCKSQWKEISVQVTPKPQLLDRIVTLCSFVTTEQEDYLAQELPSIYVYEGSQYSINKWFVKVIIPSQVTRQGASIPTSGKFFNNKNALYNDYFINHSTTNKDIIYTIIPYTNLCEGEPVTYTVTVQPNINIPVSLYEDSAEILQITSGDSYTFTVPTQENTSYLWNIDGEEQYRGNSYIFTAKEPGNYVLQLSGTSESCLSSVSSVTIEVIPSPATIIKPAVFFTPNEDGLHDTWEVENLSSYPDAMVSIYDRHHKLLAQYSGLDKGWNGYYNGHPMPMDDYWYIIEIPDGNLKLSGHFLLKR